VAEWTITNEEGLRKTYSTFEIVTRTVNDDSRWTAITSFLREATMSGYREGFSPIAIPNVGTMVNTGEPVAAIYFTLEHSHPVTEWSPEQAGSR
jgi:hypothetical protein